MGKWAQLYFFHNLIFKMVVGKVVIINYLYLASLFSFLCFYLTEKWSNHQNIVKFERFLVITILTVT